VACARGVKRRACLAGCALIWQHGSNFSKRRIGEEEAETTRWRAVIKEIGVKVQAE